MNSIVRRVKSCPNCGQIYSIHEERTNWPKDEFVWFGPLFHTCPHCGQTFRDPNAYELAVMDPPSDYLPKDYLIKFHNGTYFTAAAAVLVSVLFSGSKGNESMMVLLCFFVAALGAFLDYGRYRSHLNTIKEEQVKSRMRLQKNPQYVQMLKDAGYSVPEEYQKPKY